MRMNSPNDVSGRRGGGGGGAGVEASKPKLVPALEGAPLRGTASAASASCILTPCIRCEMEVVAPLGPGACAAVNHSALDAARHNTLSHGRGMATSEAENAGDEGEPMQSCRYAMRTALIKEIRTQKTIYSANLAPFDRLKVHPLHPCRLELKAVRCFPRCDALNQTRLSDHLRNRVTSRALSIRETVTYGDKQAMKQRTFRIRWRRPLTSALKQKHRLDQDQSDY